MLLLFLILTLSCQHELKLVFANDITLIRHVDGDVFTIPGSCNEACMVISSDTASPFGSMSSMTLTSGANGSCTCQCNDGLPIFREDLQICVDHIKECDSAGFVGASGLVEKVPYVFLPQYGQIIYPQAEIKFEGVISPVCVITGVQQLGRSGWSELRNISDVEFPLSLYRDEERTFLRWSGEAKLREAAEGKIVVVKLACRDSYPAAVYRGVFTSCVGFRVAGSPSRSSIKEVSFSTSASSSEGLTSAEYAAIGVSSALLALIYIGSVSLYLYGRKNRRKNKQRRDDEEQQQQQQNRRRSSERIGVREEPPIVKCNPLLAVNAHFESDSQSVASESEVERGATQNESEADNVTAAMIHPHRRDVVQQNCNAGSIIAERLPEEDVRVVETTENGHQYNMPVFPGTQRRKLYFNPAYFERQLLLAPPPAAVEFLLKIREVISIAKHKMVAKRFVPTLNEIAEESDRPSAAPPVPPKSGRKRASSVAASSRKSLPCTGCPGCSSTPDLPGARGLASESGESRVRAWLEDVKLLDARWRSVDDDARLLHSGQSSKLARVPARNVDAQSASMSTRSLPPAFREASLKGCANVTRESSGQFEDIEEWHRRNVREHEKSVVNANVKRAIESSFKRQLEQLQSAKMIASKPAEREPTEASGKAAKDTEQENQALLNMVNDGLSARSHSDAKRIMDAVIQELVVAKERERDLDYETDSLEKTKIKRNSSSSPASTLQSSPAQSSALPLDEEMTMRNDTIDETGSSIVHSKNLPEVVPLRAENYALVSEVYVNDGYASPSGSGDDDSGPEIQYESENPGHLTIKVLDSPSNYVKKDESDYEPDTLDRKPMRLKINGQVNYCDDKSVVDEVYVDSLERSSAQILLRSKRSFREENDLEAPVKSPREYNSLREIYEARLKYQQQTLKQQQCDRDKQLEVGNVKGDDWCSKNYRCTSPLLPRHERRQRKADNQPDVVPKPPPLPPSLDNADNSTTKNAQDRSFAEAGDPTICEDVPVAGQLASPSVVGKPPTIGGKPVNVESVIQKTLTEPGKPTDDCNNEAEKKLEDGRRSERRQQYRRFSKWRNNGSNPADNGNDGASKRQRSKSRDRSRSRSRSKSSQRTNVKQGDQLPAANLEDSAYVSSPESNCSRRRLLQSGSSGAAGQLSCSCTESDESTSGNGANSESGAESVETDSVFFGNFRVRAEREKLADRQRKVAEQQQQLGSGGYQAFQIKSSSIY